MLTRPRQIAIVTLLVLVLLPVLAFADVEYYTWGGFDPVSASFKRAAIMFGANGYKTFVAAMGVLGITVVGFNLFLNTAFQRPSTGLAMFAPIIAGGVIYAGLFVPSELVTVYDTVLNQNIAVAGVPIGVSKPAWFINSIERFVIDLLDNNPSALGEPRYQDTGVKGWDAAAQTMKAITTSSSASQTLSRYVKDCAIFEMARPGGTLSADMLSCTPAGQTFLQVLSAASNPALYTVAYIDSAGASVPAGASVSCSEAYTNITSFYNNGSNSVKDIANACVSQGFADAAQCQTVVGNILSQMQPLTNGPSGVNETLALNVAAQVTLQTLETAGTDSAASFTVLQGEGDKGMKGGVISGIINPRMIDAYIAYAVVLTPVLILLVVTPISFRVLGFILNLYVWVMFARIADVLCYHNWAAEVLRTAPELTCNVNGVTGGAGLEYQFGALPFMQSHLGALSDMRSSVFLLATMITGALFKFSDSAVARLADRGDQAANQNLSGAGGYSQKGFASTQSADVSGNAAKQALISGEAWTNIGKAGAAGSIMDSASKLAQGQAMGGPSAMDSTAGHNARQQQLRTDGEMAQYQGGKAGAVGEHTGQNATVGRGDGYNETNNRATGLKTNEGIGGKNVERVDSNGALVQRTISGSAGDGVGLSQAVTQTATANLQSATSDRQTAAGQLVEERSKTYQRAKMDATKGSNSVQAQEAKAYQKSYESAQKSALTEAAESTKSQTDSKTDELNNMLTASAGAGANLGVVKIGGAYQVTQTNKDGTTKQVALSQKQGEAYERSFASKEVSSGSKTLSHGKGSEKSTTVSSGTSYSDGVKASQSYSTAVDRVDAASKSLDEAKKLEASGSTKMETAFVENYANSKGYGTSTDGVLKAMNDLRAMESSNPRELQALKSQFVGQMAASLGIGGNAAKVDKALTAADGAMRGEGAVDAKLAALKKETNAAPKSGGSNMTEKAVNKTAIPTVSGDAEAAKSSIRHKGEVIDKVGGNMSTTAFGSVLDKTATIVEKAVRGGEFGAFGEAPSAADARDGHSYSGSSGEARAYQNIAVAPVMSVVNPVVQGVGEVVKSVESDGFVATAFPIAGKKPITGGAEAAATILGAPPAEGPKPSANIPRSKPS